MAQTHVESPPGWYPDPYGAHEHRYWDGTTWTDQTADGGVVTSPPPGHPPVRRRTWLMVGVVILVIAGGIVAWALTRGGGGGGVSLAPEAAVAADVARDLISDNAKSLGAVVPSQIPKNFPLPDDAKVIAAFEAAGSRDTVSVTYTTTTSDTEKFVYNGLEPARYQPSSDMQFSIPGTDSEKECAAFKETFGFFDSGGDFVGIITISTPGEQTSCKATITVAVGPEVIRPGSNG